MAISLTTWMILSVLLVLVCGIIIAQIGFRIIRTMQRRKYGATLENLQAPRVFSSVIYVITIILALSLLLWKTPTLGVIYPFFPAVLSYVLMFFLVIIAVRLVVIMVMRFVDSSGLITVLRDHDGEPLLKSAIVVLRIMLYVLFGLMGLHLLGVRFAIPFIEFVVIPLFAILLLFMFYVMRDFFSNVGYGIFFQYRRMFREGERIMYGGEEFFIEDISHVGIIAENKEKYVVFIPYKKLFDGEVRYLSIHPELDTLDKIKENFVAQHPSYCGPASAAMALKMFGFDISQEEIGAAAKTIVPKEGEPGGTHPTRLIRVVQQLTGGKVTGVWISVDKISSLRAEIRSWLHDDALVVIDYKKSYLFPTALKAHYSVCLGISDDELLIIDPNAQMGGVYFADVSAVYRGMDTYSPLIKGKRGYIVFALEGTRAFHRIKKNLIYSDPSLYENITKNLESQLRKVPQSLKKILPKNVSEYIEKIEGEERVSRVWKP